MQVTVLGQSDQIVEYRPDVKPKTTWKQGEAGLEITAYRAQRLYTGLPLTEPWTDLPGAAGDFEYELGGLERNRSYEYRARVYGIR